MQNKQFDIWLHNFHQLSDLYLPVTGSYQRLLNNSNANDITQTPKQNPKQWPNLAQFQSLLTARDNSILNSKQFIRFVQQSKHYQTFEEQYEPRIYLTGEIQTRTNNWHDFFQVLVWDTFPKTKTLLNSLHYQASTERLQKDVRDKQRSATENFLTLFDECGIIIVSTEKNLLDLIRNFQWTSLFWDNRAAFNQCIECFTFGHAMYEKALTPYIGMTANALLIQVNERFFRQTYPEKIQDLDNIVIQHIDEFCHSNTMGHSTLTTKNLNPFPLLGVPHWHSDNRTLKFYLNESYFRKGKHKP